MNWKPHSHWAKIKWKGTEKAFQRELMFNTSEKVKAEIISIFTKTNDSFVRDLPDSEAPMMPFITGNLHDSIVCVVSDSGMLVRASYANRAATTISKKTGKRIYTPTVGGGRKRIIGHQEAWNFVYGMQGKYPGKVASTMAVAVPYALNPEERGPHAGYLENLRNLYASAMDAEFRYAAQRHVIEFHGSLDNYIVLAYDDGDPRLAQFSTKKRGRQKGSGRMNMGSAGGGMRMIP